MEQWEAAGWPQKGDREELGTLDLPLSDVSSQSFAFRLEL
jgi:hypothetical protein